MTRTYTQSALLDLFLSSDPSICSTMDFSPLGNSGHVVVSDSVDFPSNSQQDAPFHHIAYDYPCTDWDGLCDHLSGFMLELIHISLIENIRSNFTHLHGFQLLVLLP